MSAESLVGCSSHECSRVTPHACGSHTGYLECTTLEMCDDTAIRVAFEVASKDICNNRTFFCVPVTGDRHIIMPCGIDALKLAGNKSQGRRYDQFMGATGNCTTEFSVALRE